MIAPLPSPCDDPQAPARTVRGATITAEPHEGIVRVSAHNGLGRFGLLDLPAADALALARDLALAAMTTEAGGR